jgi:hypothetical protein
MYEKENIISREGYNTGNLKPFLYWLRSETMECLTVDLLEMHLGIWQADTLPVQLSHSVGMERSSDFYAQGRRTSFWRAHLIFTRQPNLAGQNFSSTAFS